MHNSITANPGRKNAISAAPSDAKTQRETRSDDLDLPGIASLIRAHLPSVLTIAGLTLILGLAFAVMKKPEYVSAAVIDVNEPVSLGSDLKSKAPRASLNSGGRDLALLRSRFLAQRVLQNLSGQNSPSPEAVSRFLDHLQISQPPGSTVINISFRDRSPNKAARAVDQVIESFRKIKAEELSSSFNEEKLYVDDEIKQRRRDLAVAERSMDEFRKNAGIADDVSITVKARLAGTLNSQLALAQAKAEEAAARWRQVETLSRAGNMTAVSTVINSPLVRSFREKEVVLLDRINELRNEYGPRHPRLIGVKSQLKELRANIERELRYSVETVKNESNVAQQRVTDLQQQIDKLENEIAKAQTSPDGLEALKLEAEVIREQYRNLLERASLLGPQAQELAKAKLVNVISPAYTPGSPIFPTATHIVLLTAALALLLGLLTAFLAEYFNPKITRQRAPFPPSPAFPPGVNMGQVTSPGSQFAPPSPGLDPSGTHAEADDLRLIPGLPEGDSGPIVIPIPGDGSGIVPATELLRKQRSKFASAVASLNQTLLARLHNGGPKVMVITGSNCIGDKVSVAVALATLNAKQGQRVVLADLTHGESEIHRAFAMSPEPGLAEIINKTTTLPKAFQTDFLTHVTLLSRGEFLDHHLMMKMIDATPSLIMLLKKYFDLVIVVTRNVEIATEAELAFDQHVDQAVIVLSPNAGQPRVKPGEYLKNPKLQRLKSRLMPAIVRRA